MVAVTVVERSLRWGARLAQWYHSPIERPLIYRLIYQPTGQTVAADIELAHSVWRKGVGLLGRAKLQPGSGMWLPGVRSIHTFGMMFPIDVLFLDEKMRTTRVVASMPPGRVCVAPPETRHCIELAAGTLPKEDQRAALDRWSLKPAI